MSGGGGERREAPSEGSHHSLQASRKQRRKKTGPKKEKEFLDVAHEAFVRHLALDLWRRVGAVREARGDPEVAEGLLRSVTAFDERFPYQATWQAAWRDRVADFLWSAESTDLLGRIERMVAAALDAEEAERKARGDVSIHDEDDYIGFIDDQLAYLFSHREDEFLTG